MLFPFLTLFFFINCIRYNSGSLYMKGLSLSLSREKKKEEKMASLFRDLSLGHSKRESPPLKPPLKLQQLSIMPSKPTITTTDLDSPLGQLATQLTDPDLRSTAYEIFVAACRTSSGKPLTYTPNPSNSDSTTNHSNHSPNSPALQRSLTSAAASKMKKALGLKSPGSGSKKSPGSGSSSGSGQGKARRALTVGELMRAQMRVSETVDSRIRRALLRIAAGQVGFILFCSILIFL